MPRNDIGLKTRESLRQLRGLHTLKRKLAILIGNSARADDLNAMQMPVFRSERIHSLNIHELIARPSQHNDRSVDRFTGRRNNVAGNGKDHSELVIRSVQDFAITYREIKSLASIDATLLFAMIIGDVTFKSDTLGVLRRSDLTMYRGHLRNKH